MKVVALDLATQTGVAAGDSGDAPRTWSVDLGRRQSEESRFAQAIDLTRDIVAKEAPDLIVVEAAIGGKHASAFLIGLVACVRGAARSLCVPVEVLHLGSVRKHFVGRSLTARDFPSLGPAAAKRAMKGVVMRRCEMLGWPVESDDEADAAACWDYACATMAKGYQAAPGGELFHD